MYTWANIDITSANENIYSNNEVYKCKCKDNSCIEKRSAIRDIGEV